jgi:hypothetical protein
LEMISFGKESKALKDTSSEKASGKPNGLLKSLAVES